MSKPLEPKLSYSDLIQKAAELAVGMEVPAVPNNAISTPILSGTLLEQVVQPGLAATAADLSFMTDYSEQASLNPSIICALLLAGESSILDVPDYGPLPLTLNRPVILGVGETITCRHRCHSGLKTRISGFVITPAFLDRFGAVIKDDGLHELRNFIDSNVKIEILPYTAKVSSIASQNLARNYLGALNILFLESNVLRFVIEIAELLKENRKIIETIGRKKYESAMHAREIIDRSIINPPKILDLAKSVGVNVTSLQASFKLAFGSTIFGYIRNQRLNMARILIIDHRLPISDAGYRVGYSSPAAFTAAYRHHFGHPPSAERGAVTRR